MTGTGGLVTFQPVSQDPAYIERLIDDEELWERRSEDGLAFAADHTWKAAAVEVEAGLRAALREREQLLDQA